MNGRIDETLADLERTLFSMCTSQKLWLASMCGSPSGQVVALRAVPTQRNLAKEEGRNPRCIYAGVTRVFISLVVSGRGQAQSAVV